jgi:hypothetical protein
MAVQVGEVNEAGLAGDGLEGEVGGCQQALDVG